MTAANNEQPSIKQQRAARRAEKVAAHRREEERKRRTRRITVASSVVGAVAVLGLAVTFIVTSAPSTLRPEDITIAGVEEFEGLSANHVPSLVDYESDYGMTPPAGGDHNQAWLNCGIYDVPQQNEHAVHSLEHGAVWVTYDAEVVSDEEIEQLRASLPSTYIVMSPYEGLDSPIVASAWGAQLALDSADDERLQQFIDKYWKSAAAPEPGASCVGAIEGPGRVI